MAVDHCGGRLRLCVYRAWQAFLRRFDLEHAFRFLKQHLGWTRPKLRDPAAADRWTWLVLDLPPPTCYLARAPRRRPPPALAAALPARPPHPRPRPPRLSAASAGSLPVPASAPKPSLRPAPAARPAPKSQPPRHPPRRPQEHKSGKQASKDPQTDR